MHDEAGDEPLPTLVTGYALAASPPVRRAIDAIANLPKSGAGGAALVASVAVLAGLVNWGLALVVGALLARAVGRSLQRRGIPCHYPLLAAAGYLGMLVWHGGFSGSAPLKMTTAAAASEILPAEIVAERAADGIPLSQLWLADVVPDLKLCRFSYLVVPRGQLRGQGAIRVLLHEKVSSGDGQLNPGERWLLDVVVDMPNR